MVLNYKKIPYTESFISYPDIAAVLQALEVAPLPAGIPYTVPAIIHKSSITSNHYGAMNDSLPIALHLEKTFYGPEHPTIFPNGDASYALAAAVQSIFQSVMLVCGSRVYPKVADILDERGAAYYYRTRSTRFGKPLVEVLPRTSEEAQEVIGNTLPKLKPVLQMLRGREDKVGPFFEGDQPGYADFVAAGYLVWFHRADEELWSAVVNSGNQELLKLWEATRPYWSGQGEVKDWKVGGP
jgi:glutathione S-transferase